VLFIQATQVGRNLDRVEKRSGCCHDPNNIVTKRRVE
jgi:hypothetical protein